MGVPIPEQSAQFERSQIVRRAIRVGIYDSIKKDLIHNTA